MRMLLKRLANSVFPPEILFLLKSRHYARIVGDFSEAELDVISPLILPGDVVVDLGANVGWYTIFFSKKVGQHGSVYSVEPVYETFRLLSAVVKRYGCTNVLLFNCAASDREGRAEMVVPVNQQGMKNYYRSHISAETDSERKEAGSLTVELRRLDQILGNNCGKVSFIKCDVEGHEKSALIGASEVLTNSRPACLVEITSSLAESSEIFSEMTSMGYGVYWYDRTGRKLFREINRKIVNYFFLKDEHISALKRAGMTVVEP